MTITEVFKNKGFNPILTDTQHEYRLGRRGAVRLPGVTSLMRDNALFGNNEYMMKSPHAAERGTLIHKLTALDDEGDLDEASVDPELKPYLTGWRKFTESVQHSPILIEFSVYHPVKMFAGTLDRLSLIVHDGKVYLALIELKTGVLCGWHWIQTMAYAKAVEAWQHQIPELDGYDQIDRLYVVQVTKGGTFRLHFIDRSSKDWREAERTLDSAIQINRWKVMYDAA